MIDCIILMYTRVVVSKPIITAITHRSNRSQRPSVHLPDEWVINVCIFIFCLLKVRYVYITETVLCTDVFFSHK